jgi:hypothetical protein
MIFSFMRGPDKERVPERLLRLTYPQSDVGMQQHRHNSRGEREGQPYSQYSAGKLSRELGGKNEPQ